VAVKVNPLPNGAVEVSGIDISQPDTYTDIKHILEQDLVVVIRQQPTDPLYFTQLIQTINPIANWQQCIWDEEGNDIGPPRRHDKPFSNVQRVTGEKRDGESTGIFGIGRLDWHANLNGPDRADGVALQGIKGVEGTVTSWLNTSLALHKMPDELKTRIEDVYCSYYYNVLNWADIEFEAQKAYLANRQAPYEMWLEQENIAGVKGLYFYPNNDCQMQTEDVDLFEDLKEYIFQEQFMYHHEWQVGDIVLSDQLLTLHKRQLREENVFRKRVLHRLTFPISNTGNPKRLELLNQI
jgi:taurine dioxygenase